MSSYNPSMRWRIIVRLMLVTLFLSTIGYGIVVTEFSSVATGMENSTLYEEAENLSDRIVMAPDGSLSVKLSDEMNRNFENGSHRFAILTTDYGILEQSQTPPTPLANVALMHPGSDLPIFEDLIGVYQLPTNIPKTFQYGAVTQETIKGRTVLIQVERITNRFNLLSRTLLDEFFDEGAWLGIPFLLVLMIASIITVNQTLSPLHAISRKARQIGPSNPGERLSLENVPTEIAPLVRAVNGALDRMEQAFQTQKEITADAAHELRTPLAILRSRIDMLPANEEKIALQKNIGSMARIVDQLMKMAQLDTATISKDERADLVSVVREASIIMGPLTISTNLELELDAPNHAIFVRGKGDPLFHAVRNLIENAMKYAPDGSIVTVRVSDLPQPFVEVIDHGPGVPENLREKIFTRFWQGDQRQMVRNMDQAGAGLGLAIVARVMAVHGGSVSVGDTPGGGATFSLRFPAVTPA